MKRYELSNHPEASSGQVLGNVLAVITDNINIDESQVTASVASVSDYYPFGLAMPGRTFSADEYRYGFNGKEKDPEGLGGGGSTYDYGFRIYNPGIGKFLSVDPLTKEYPMLTPYQFASNRPIDGIDLDGLEYLHWSAVQFKFMTGANKLQEAAMNVTINSNNLKEYYPYMYDELRMSGIYFNPNRNASERSFSDEVVFRHSGKVEIMYMKSGFKKQNGQFIETPNTVYQSYKDKQFAFYSRSISAGRAHGAGAWLEFAFLLTDYIFDLKLARAKSEYYDFYRRDIVASNNVLDLFTMAIDQNLIPAEILYDREKVNELANLILSAETISEDRDLHNLSRYLYRHETKIREGRADEISEMHPLKFRDNTWRKNYSDDPIRNSTEK